MRQEREEETEILDFGGTRILHALELVMLTRSLTFKNIDHSRGQKELFYIAVSGFRHTYGLDNKHKATHQGTLKLKDTSSSLQRANNSAVPYIYLY